MRKQKTARTQAFEHFWKKRSRGILPPHFAMTRAVAEAAWNAAWDHRDQFGPDEVEARAKPLCGDTWTKLTAREVRVTRTIDVFEPNGVDVWVNERRGFDDIRLCMTLKAFIRWTKQATLKRRGIQTAQQAAARLSSWFTVNFGEFDVKVIVVGSPNFGPVGSPRGLLVRVIRAWRAHQRTYSTGQLPDEWEGIPVSYRRDVKPRQRTA